MYLQPQLTTVSRKPVIHNPFAGYKRSAQNNKPRINVWEIERLGLGFWQCNRLFVFHCYSELMARNIGAGIAEEGWEGQLVRFHVAAEFKYQSSDRISKPSARTIINQNYAGLSGSFLSRILSNPFILLQAASEEFSIWPAHLAAFHENYGHAFLLMADGVSVSEK
jgi:hypothetical protein